MNLCTHCSLGMFLQVSSQLCTCSLGKLWPLYRTSQPSTWSKKRTVNKVRHCTHSAMFFLCVPHHVVGVAFKDSSSANNLYCTGAIPSNSTRNVSKWFKPSNFERLITFVPIQQTTLVNLAHRRVETSYIMFCQFSNASSESYEHALSLHQLRFPSVVGLM